MAKLQAKPRPTNLPVAKVHPDADLPVKVPGDMADEATFGWLEKLRDHHEKAGELLDVAGMNVYANIVDAKDTLLKEQIQKFYGKGASKPPAKSAKVAPTPKAAKPAGKKEVMATATKAAPAKAGNKAAKNKNGKGNPAKSGKSSPAPKAKVKAKATPAPTGKIVLERTVRGVEVLVKQVNGSFRGTAAGIPLRGVLRFFGAKKKTPDEARSAVARMLVGWKGGEDYAAAMVEEGHVGSGAKEAAGETGSFGPAPDVDKKTAALLLAFCK